MNNAFQRLKHYRLHPGGLDAKENHATECLAACLVFSDEIKHELLKFLLGEKAQPFLQGSSNIDVVTQCPVDTGGWIDLLLRTPGKLNVGIEAKVGSNERSDQLKQYRAWLDRQPGEKYLFTLVRDQDGNFSSEHTHGRHTWRRLREKLTSHTWASDVSRKIVSQFCEYLETELNVINWKTTDLEALSSGRRAESALRAIFASVLERARGELKLTGELRESNAIWWRIHVGGDSWNSTFGKGNNLKLFIWYRIAPIWGTQQDEEGFAFDFQLWNKDHGIEWAATKVKLDSWIRFLKERQFSVWLAETYQGEHREISSTEEIGGTPAFVRTSRASDILLFKDLQKMTQEQLVEELFLRISEFDEIVKSLAR